MLAGQTFLRLSFALGPPWLSKHRLSQPDPRVDELLPAAGAAAMEGMYKCTRHRKVKNRARISKTTRGCHNSKGLLGGLSSGICRVASITSFHCLKTVCSASIPLRLRQRSIRYH